MLSIPTIEKLGSLGLEGMIQALEEQRPQQGFTQLDFEARLALLVERQCLWRSNRALVTRLRIAQFKIAAPLKELDYRHPRGLKRAQIDQLRQSDWISAHRGCLITGPSGCGKTYLSCALGHQACRAGHRVLYCYAPKLFRELQSATADGSLQKRLKALTRFQLIVIDDLGVAAATARQYRHLLEILDDRLGRGATLITSQFPVSQWHELIGDATVADAFLDRLVHQAYRIELKGESMRKVRTGEASKAAPSES